MHCDTPGRMLSEGLKLGERHEYTQVDIAGMREGGVDASFFAVFASATNNTPLESVKAGFEILDMIVEEVGRYPDDLALATTADEVLRAKQEGKIAILLSVEGGHMIDSSLAVLRDFRRLGARSMTLTHSAPTAWASAAESDEGPDGLTDFGKDVVREMNRLGMLVDLSHGADKSFWDAIETSKAPIITSHSCCRAVASHPRNMDDDMLQALAKNGGVIHLAYYAAMLDDDYRARLGEIADIGAKRSKARSELAGNKEELSAALWQLNLEEVERIGQVPLSRLIDHFEHAATVAGVDHVGFGSDLDSVRLFVPQGLERIQDTPNLAAGLRERGFSEEDTAKMMGGNTFRVLQEAEQVAAELSG